MNADFHVVCKKKCSISLYYSRLFVVEKPECLQCLHKLSIVQPACLVMQEMSRQKYPKKQKVIVSISSGKLSFRDLKSQGI